MMLILKIATSLGLVWMAAFAVLWGTERSLRRAAECASLSVALAAAGVGVAYLITLVWGLQ